MLAARLTKRSARAAICLSAVLLAAAPAAAGADSRHDGPEPVVEWNQATLQLLAAPGVQPITVHPTRTLALVHVAMHDAVNAIRREYEPYLVREWAPGGASARAAAIAAGHGVLTQLYPSQRASLDERRAADLGELPNNLARRIGVAVGEYVSERLVETAVGDGATATQPPLAPGTLPGEWRPTPPAFAAAQFTHYPDVRPFVLRRASQFRSDPPPSLSSSTYAAALNEVRSVGSATSTTRTADQTDAARFWGSPIHIYWNTIPQRVALDRDLSLERTARLFALMNLALGDATIAFYDSKYRYRLWRPVTAIREVDPSWTPLLNTPADPSYPGAHSALGAAGAEILREVFHRDIGVVVTSPAVPGATRSFRAASAAADEAGLSRLWAGVHWRFDDPSGQEQGIAIARYVADRELEPRDSR
jgi:PAP2 superfamily protein